MTPLDWSDFTVNIHSSEPSFDSVKQIIEEYSQKVVDLRPFM